VGFDERCHAQLFAQSDHVCRLAAAQGHDHQKYQVGAVGAGAPTTGRGRP
jgi:hypothetical protein